MSEQKSVYVIHSTDDIQQLAGQMNLILAQLADRLDQNEGLRGSPTFYSHIDLKGNLVKNVAAPIDAGDAVPLATLNSTAAGLNSTIADATSGLQQSLGTTTQDLFLRGDNTWAKPNLDYYTNAIAADVALTLANTYYDGPSISLPSGTWLLTGAVALMGLGTDFGQAKLWDGSTVYASGETPGGRGSIAVSGIAVLGATTTIKISSAATATGVTMKAAMYDNPVGNNSSYLVAMRIA